MGLFSDHAVLPPSSPGMPGRKQTRAFLRGLLAPLWFSVGELEDCQKANALGLPALLAAASKARAQERWLRALPRGGHSRGMGGSQEAEKMRHSSEQCQGLSVGTGRGNQARGCRKQRHTATYACSRWERDKAAKDGGSPAVQAPLAISAKAALCLVTGRPPPASAGCPRGLRDMWVSWHVSQNHRGSAGGRAAFWDGLLTS